MKRTRSGAGIGLPAVSTPRANSFCAQRVAVNARNSAWGQPHSAKLSAELGLSCQIDSASTGLVTSFPVIQPREGFITIPRRGPQSRAMLGYLLDPLPPRPVADAAAPPHGRLRGLH